MSRQQPVQAQHKNSQALWFILALFLFFVGAISSLFIGTVHSETNPPNIITYQGKILESGSAVTSTKSMKFLLYDAAAGGNLLYTASGTLGVTQAISVTPSSGIFAVDIGGSGTNALSPSIFAENSNLYLEVQVGATTLSPRKRITTAPFALNARYLMGITATTTSSSTHIPVSDANGNFTFTGTPQSNQVGGGVVYINPSAADADEVLLGAAVNGSKKFTLDEDGDGYFERNLTASTTFHVDSSNNKVGINSSTPQYSLSVNGTSFFSGTSTFSDVVNVSGRTLNPRSYSRYTSSTILGDARALDVVGNYAYVAAGNFDNDTVSILDITDPSSPSLVGYIHNGDGGVTLDNPEEIITRGKYSYVLAGNSNALVVLDVSDPTNPVEAGSIADGGSVLLNNPNDLAIQGNYAYIASFGDDAIEIVDISDPNNPTHIAALQDAVNLNGVRGLKVKGNYVYAVARLADKMTIIDVSDPYSPVIVGSIANGSGGASLDAPHNLFLQGKYAFIAVNGSGGNGDGAVEIVDVSDPTSPVHVGKLTGLTSVETIFVSGDYAYIVENSNNRLVIANISDPTAPVSVGSLSHGGSTNLSNPTDIVVIGNYAYVAAGGGDAVEIIDVSGAEIGRADVGSVRISDLTVNAQATFEDQVHVRKGLQIDDNGLIVGGDITLYNPSVSNSTSSIRISDRLQVKSLASSTETHPFIFDTQNQLTVTSTSYLLSLRNNGTPTFSVATDGSVHTTGTYHGSSINVGDDGAPGDFAEQVDINPAEQVEPGDVIVVDPLGIDRYAKSKGAYASSIAGVISTNPTLVVGRGKTKHTALLAMVGRVPVKVSGENGAISAGDLLVSASIPGYAMKYDPSVDPGEGSVGIIGMAVESFDGETGKIMSLVKSGWVSNQHQTIAEVQQDLLSVADAAGVDFQPRQQLNVVERGDGTIGKVTKDLNVNGHYILNVAGISGKNNAWQIDEQGRFVTHVATKEGTTPLYAIQSQQTEYVFSGTGELTDGEADVTFDTVTQQIIDPDAPLKVSVTLTSEANGVYISEKSTKGFSVKELQGGASNATFDWVVIAKRHLDGELNENEEEDVLEPEEQQDPQQEDNGGNNEHQDENKDAEEDEQQEQENDEENNNEQEPQIVEDDDGDVAQENEAPQQEVQDDDQGEQNLEADNQQAQEEQPPEDEPEEAEQPQDQGDPAQEPVVEEEPAEQQIPQEEIQPQPQQEVPEPEPQEDQAPVEDEPVEEPVT